MRFRAHFDFINWVGVAICPLNSFTRLDGRLRQKLKLTRGVVKYHVSVVWMNIAFHAIARFNVAFLK